MTTPTNGPYTPPQHGDKMNGHTFDAHENEWKPDYQSADGYDAAAHSAYYMGHGGSGQKIGTKKMIIGVCAVAATVLALIGIANVVADSRDGNAENTLSSSPVYSQTPEEQFIAAYKDAGYTNRTGDKGILDGGYTVCEGLDAGLTERQLVQAGYQGNQDTNGTMDRSDIQVIVDLATEYICPEYS